MDSLSQLQFIFNSFTRFFEEDYKGLLQIDFSQLITQIETDPSQRNKDSLQSFFDFLFGLSPNNPSQQIVKLVNDSINHYGTPKPCKTISLRQLLDEIQIQEYKKEIFQIFDGMLEDQIEVDKLENELQLKKRLYEISMKKLNAAIESGSKQHHNLEKYYLRIVQNLQFQIDIMSEANVEQMKKGSAEIAQGHH